MPDGYMVANIGSVSSASDGYVYDVTIIPGAFSNNISYPLAKGVNAGTVADPSSSIATQPAGAVANKQTLSTLRNGVWVTGNLTGAEPSVSLATKASTTVADLSSSAVVDALYDKATVGATNIPVSYQVVFNSQTSNPVSQPAPDPTNKDAVVLDFGNKGGSQGIYFTEPGTGNMVYNVPDPSSESVESVEVTDLPIVADNNSYVLGWYTHSFNKDGQDIYGPEPLTEVAPVTQNTINYALYGKFELVNKNLVLGNSPISIMAGESGSYTATLKININPSPAGVQTQEPAIVIDPSVVQIQNHGKSIISDDSINYGTGTDNGEMNGVQLGEPSLTAGEAEGTYTLDIPVMTGGNASQGAYQVNVKLNLNGLSATDGTTLQGVLNIDGVAADADIAVIRYYNPYDGEHVLTTVQNESLALLTAGWLPEDIAWFAPADGQAVYRLYNPYNHDHYYTTDEAEVNSLVTLGWEKDFVNADGTQTPVFYGDTESSLYPVFQLFNPYVTSGTHLWTTNTVEVASLINPSVGWKNEGPKWFASYPGTNL